jgi:hypothetical protein
MVTHSSFSGVSSSMKEGALRLYGSNHITQDAPVPGGGVPYWGSPARTISLTPITSSSTCGGEGMTSYATPTVGAVWAPPSNCLSFDCSDVDDSTSTGSKTTCAVTAAGPPLLGGCSTPVVGAP